MIKLVVSGTVSGNVVTLKLKEPSPAKKITYVKETNWSQDRLLIGANGIAALTFAEVELGSYNGQSNDLYCADGDSGRVIAPATSKHIKRARVAAGV